MKTVKCYNFENVQRLLDYHKPENMEQYESWLSLIFNNGVRVFTTPKSVGSGRARKQPVKYLSTNDWFDQYMKEQNTWQALKGKTPVKPGYKAREETLEIMLPWFE